MDEWQGYPDINKPYDSQDPYKDRDRYKDKYDEITTLNDDGNPRRPGEGGGFLDPNLQKGPLKPKSTEEALSLRMSTTISGIIIGIVASIVIAILILIFAVYKYKNRTEIAQHAIRIDTIKIDPMNSSNTSNTYNNNNNHNTYDSSRTNNSPYSMITPGKSIMKNGGGAASTAINTLTRASIDHQLHDSKEWYVWKRRKKIYFRKIKY